ncbi:MAG TPA: OsmC family protein [Gaiellaceae bacterium]|nr:OsmC family protein [Gaiellaceae bacterium]
MATVKPKVLEYHVELDGAGRMTIPGGGQIVPPAGWSADHLLLAALVRCSIDSLAYHARRTGSSLEATGSAHGRITKTGEDGRYRFVHIDVRIDARLTPRADDVDALVAKAERDCFVGASLLVKPEYQWRLS